MTDTIKLKQYIEDSGYKLEFIAKKCGLTYQGLKNKVENKTEFKATEIQALKDLLNMSTEESTAVFFCADSR